MTSRFHLQDMPDLLVPEIARAAWKKDAACSEAPIDLFFPAVGFHSAAEAKVICERCPVRVQCLSHALITNERHGIWGGKTERERRRYRRLWVAAAE